MANRLWEQTVDYLVGSSVAANCDEVSATTRIGIASDLRGLPGRPGGRDLYFDAGIAQTLQCRTEQFIRASAACRRIHYCKIRLPQADSLATHAIEFVPTALSSSELYNWTTAV